MKSTLIAAAMLLGSASAGVHKMKLQKIPLSEQLVSAALQFCKPLDSSALIHVLIADFI
jgi:hypothetical protein